MSKEAMKLALEGAANYIDALGGDSRKYRQALANEALDKKAENARELGLDYEPRRWAVFCQGCRKEWSVSYPHPGKSICADCDDKLAGQPSPVAKPHEQEPVAWRNVALRVGEDLCSVGPFGYYNMTAEQWLDWALSVVTVHALQAQRTWVGLSDEEKRQLFDREDYQGWLDYINAIEAKLKEKNT